MLLVIGAQATVVRAAPLYGSVVDHGHLGALDENFAAAAIVIDIVGDQHAFRAVFGAALQQEDFAVLENDFAFQFVEARGTNGDGHVVERVGPNALGHISFLPAVKKVQTTSTTTHKRAARNSAAAPKNAQAKMVLAGCWDDEFGQLPQVETSPKNDPPVSSTAQPKVIRAGKKGERRRGWLGAGGVGCELGVWVMLPVSSGGDLAGIPGCGAARHCSPLAARTKNAMIAASAQMPAAITPRTPTKNPMANRVDLLELFEVRVLTKPKQEPAASRIPPSRVSRMGFTWYARGRGASGAGGGGGVVNDSPLVNVRAMQLLRARRLRSFKFGWLCVGNLSNSAEPAQNVWGIVQQHENAGPLNRGYVGQNANLRLEEIHAQTKREISDHEELEQIAVAMWAPRKGKNQRCQEKRER